jgi:threonine synthase
MVAAGFIAKSPKLAVIQAAGSAPFYDYMTVRGKHDFHAVGHPETLATAIKIGDPVSWPKAQFEIETAGGVVESVTEQEIADAKAQIGLAGIGCEPASAASLAGLKKLVKAGVIARDADVVGILTGSVLKDPDYIYRYHTGALAGPDGVKIHPTFGNAPTVLPNDIDVISRLLS